MPLSIVLQDVDIHAPGQSQETKESKRQPFDWTSTGLEFHPVKRAQHQSDSLGGNHREPDGKLSQMKCGFAAVTLARDGRKYV
ncbi:hypothetical protein E5288_WYG003421 [Bos mutus]|uniref:Uncharacterized protein n=1 Tax=Bos mutus TaxID=72004 RepID=A0A6B0S3A7_9CETA|nr:hypothetical protein [Bos mutus]